MRHIQSFTNDAAIQDALDNGTLGKPYVALNNQTGTIDWDSKTPTEPKDMYLTIEALSGGTFYVRKADIGYSVNGADWETTTGETALALNQGDKVRFKGTAGGNSLFSGNTLAFNAYGNVESLEYGDNFINQGTSVHLVRAFTNCFRSCSGLTDASNLVLPATTLADRCYTTMFSGCASLTTAPALPATALTDFCYTSMFYGCTSLTKAPALPATILANYCYSNMFYYCTSLTTAPELPATTLANNCYTTMFSGCASLTTAPELPATTLTDYCYSGMFSGCTSLNYIKCLATDISAYDCTNNWVKGVAASGTFVKDPSMASWTTGVNGIPSGWTVIPTPAPTTMGTWTGKSFQITETGTTYWGLPVKIGVLNDVYLDGNQDSPDVMLSYNSLSDAWHMEFASEIVSSPMEHDFSELDPFWNSGVMTDPAETSSSIDVAYDGTDTFTFTIADGFLTPINPDYPAGE